MGTRRRLRTSVRLMLPVVLWLSAVGVFVIFSSYVASVPYCHGFLVSLTSLLCTSCPFRSHIFLALSTFRGSASVCVSVSLSLSLYLYPSLSLSPSLASVPLSPTLSPSLSPPSISLMVLVSCGVFMFLSLHAHVTSPCLEYASPKRRIESKGSCRLIDLEL